MNGFVGIVLVAVVASACQASAVTLKELPLSPWEILTLSGFSKENPCDTLSKQAESIIAARPGSTDTVMDVFEAAVASIEKMPKNPEFEAMESSIKACVGINTPLSPWDLLHLAGYTQNTELSPCEALKKQAEAVAANRPDTSAQDVLVVAKRALAQKPFNNDIQGMIDDLNTCV